MIHDNQPCTIQPSEPPTKLEWRNTTPPQNATHHSPLASSCERCASHNRVAYMIVQNKWPQKGYNCNEKSSFWCNPKCLLVFSIAPYPHLICITIDQPNSPTCHLSASWNLSWECDYIPMRAPTSIHAMPAPTRLNSTPPHPVCQNAWLPNC